MNPIKCVMKTANVCVVDVGGESRQVQNWTGVQK